MFYFYYIPFVDLRGFNHDAGGRLSKPPWPIVQSGQDFIRNFGVVERRRRGGLTSFPGEDFYCRAANALRVPPINEDSHEPYLTPDKRRFRCSYRRLYFDGRCVGKYEIGFRQLGTSTSKANKLSDEWLASIRTILESKVCVSQHDDVRRTIAPLVRAGPPLADLYLKCSTKHNVSESPRLVLPCEPMILLQFKCSDVTDWPRHSRAVNVPVEGVELRHNRVACLGITLGVWYLGFAGNSHPQQVRDLRLHICRLHAEYQCLRAVLRGVAGDQVVFDTRTESCDNLQRYLRDAYRLLAKRERYGVEQEPILATVRDSMDLVSAGERASLLTRLEQVRQNILRAVERNTTVGPDRQTQVLVLGTANFREAREVTIGGATMTEYNVQIGDNATFHGNFTVANSIQDSFNTLKQSSLPANVHSTVETLIKQVAEMSARLPADAAKQTADDLNAFVKEASSQQPRRKWYELSAEGLLDAAKAVGEVGKPVIETVKALLALLA